MDLEPYVTQVREQLIAAARIGDEGTRQTAAALAEATGPAVRLALLSAVSGALEEISAQLDDATAKAYLDGDDIRVELTQAELSPEMPADDGEVSARISLRLSESLKTQVELAARSEVISVNTWLVRAAGLALGRQRFARGTRSHQQHHITGWING